MSRRRVVVTGLGCVSPVGNTVAESWASLLAGRSGIDAITQFDAAAFACRFAAPRNWRGPCGATLES